MDKKVEFNFVVAKYSGQGRGTVFSKGPLDTENIIPRPEDTGRQATAARSGYVPVPGPEHKNSWAGLGCPSVLV